MSADAETKGNIQQRVWDAIPEHPGIVTLDTLVATLPYGKDGIIEALYRLRGQRIVELAPRTVCCVYRRVKGARRPIDMRGQHGRSGRRKGVAA